MAKVRAVDIQNWDTSEQKRDPETNRKVWVPARPCRCDSFLSRLKSAWRVLKGLSDELTWEL